MLDANTKDPTAAILRFADDACKDKATSALVALTESLAIEAESKKAHSRNGVALADLAAAVREAFAADHVGCADGMLEATGGLDEAASCLRFEAQWEVDNRPYVDRNAEHYTTSGVFHF